MAWRENEVTEGPPCRQERVSLSVTETEVQWSLSTQYAHLAECLESWHVQLDGHPVRASLENCNQVQLISFQISFTVRVFPTMSPKSQCCLAFAQPQLCDFERRSRICSASRLGEACNINAVGRSELTCGSHAMLTIVTAKLEPA